MFIFYNFILSLLKYMLVTNSKILDFQDINNIKIIKENKRKIWQKQKYFIIKENKTRNNKRRFANPGSNMAPIHTNDT